MNFINSETSEPVFGYYINLDERGDFQADVRDENGNTVFDIRAGNSLANDESSIFEDGFMASKNDVTGLADYLRGMGVIPAFALVLSMREFESRATQHTDDLVEAVAS